MAGSVGLAEQVALSIGQGAVSEQVASQLQEALPEVSFLRYELKMLKPTYLTHGANARFSPLEHPPLRTAGTVQRGRQG